MSISFYFRECPTCGNRTVALVRNADIRARGRLNVNKVIDEKYVSALPDVWGTDAKMLESHGAKLPCLYNDKTGKYLNIDVDRVEMSDLIDEFIDVRNG